MWTESAWTDLEAATDFIARDSRHYAASFAREVREASRSLEHLAERGRIVPEFLEPDMRELFVRNYRLIYKLTEKDVYILGFIHGSRDLWKLWKP